MLLNGGNHPASTFPGDPKTVHSSRAVRLPNGRSRIHRLIQKFVATLHILPSSFPAISTISLSTFLWKARIWNSLHAVWEQPFFYEFHKPITYRHGVLFMFFLIRCMDLAPRISISGFAVEIMMRNCKKSRVREENGMSGFCCFMKKTIKITSTYHRQLFFMIFATIKSQRASGQSRENQ